MSVLSTGHQFSAGSALLTRWQTGDDAAQDELRTLFDAVIEGQYDAVFQEPAPPDSVCVTASLHLTTLAILNQLYGLSSADFYKDDPQRYVRTTLLTQRLLGIRKLTLHWPVYAFGAEALGQAIMYPDTHPPGVETGELLVNKKNWHKLEPPDFEGVIPQVIEEMLACFTELTGREPVAHLPAPYSLAADIFGQEALPFALIDATDFVDDLLTHLTEHVLAPWCERLSRRFPNIWLELSDASGSPNFIGPRLTMEIAARPVGQLINDYFWGNRIFVANYRGDPAAGTSGSVTLTEMINFKLSVCPEFIIKLEADRAPLSFYVEQAVQRDKPLYLGIGATRIDLNSIVDHETAKREISDLSAAYAQAIKTVSEALAHNGYSRSDLAWPGDVYIEDINAESDFDLVKTIVESVTSHGKVAS